MNKVKIDIWNKPCNLKVIFECYGNQEPTIGQKTRLNTFIANTKAIDGALTKVKQICLDDEKMNGSNEISNIFEYVTPKSIYVKRNDKQDLIVLLCDYKYDIEHGLAIVFEKGTLKEIVRQGDI